MSDLTRDVLRWALLIGSAPIWWPFLRTLWRDFNDALREEGGLFGRPPTDRELERLRAERAAQPPTLTSEPLVRTGEHRRTRLGAHTGPARAPGTPGARAPSQRSAAQRPRGFR